MPAVDRDLTEQKRYNCSKVSCRYASWTRSAGDGEGCVTETPSLQQPSERDYRTSTSQLVEITTRHIDLPPVPNLMSSIHKTLFLSLPQMPDATEETEPLMIRFTQREQMKSK